MGRGRERILVTPTLFITDPNVFRKGIIWDTKKKMSLMVVAGYMFPHMMVAGCMGTQAPASGSVRMCFLK